MLDTDGTLIYGCMINYLCKCERRNQQIVIDLISNSAHSNIILSERVEHLETLMNGLPEKTKTKKRF